MQLDESIKALGVNVPKSPPHCPNANAICERVIGTIRRECLDWLIPISESHLRSILTSWVEHYYRGRPHAPRPLLHAVPKRARPKNCVTSSSNKSCSQH